MHRKLNGLCSTHLIKTIGHLLFTFSTDNPAISINSITFFFIKIRKSHGLSTDTRRNHPPLRSVTWINAWIYKDCKTKSLYTEICLHLMANGKGKALIVHFSWIVWWMCLCVWCDTAYNPNISDRMEYSSRKFIIDAYESSKRPKQMLTEAMLGWKVYFRWNALFRLNGFSYSTQQQKAKMGECFGAK